MPSFDYVRGIKIQFRKNNAVLLIFIILALTGCNPGVTEQVQSTEKIMSSSVIVDKIEIYHFHGTNQCASCIAVGKLAEETVNTYFADELKSGKIVFGHVNAELPENRELANKYGVTSASLWIGVYDSSGFHKEQNTNVWYKTGDKNEYLAYLKGIIEKRLSGDLS